MSPSIPTAGALIVSGLATLMPAADGIHPPGADQREAIEAPWPMHRIDSEEWNHNSLSPGDIDHDGFTDYAVIHEGPDLYSLIFHPGSSGDPRAPWTKVVIGRGDNVEYASLGDFDGDGHLDCVGVEGYGARSGMRMFWGPAPSRGRDPSAWTDGGYVPACAERGHPLFVEVHDVDGDGRDDVMVGGRVGRGRTNGLFWMRSPDQPESRRDLAAWRLFEIDPGLLSGHGFIRADIDQDGDLDIAICNADWNTPEDQEAVLWYENPGDGVEAQRRPWPRHVVYQGADLYSKAQVAAGDVDGDGLTDLCIQTVDEVFLLRKTGLDPMSWDRIVIPKPEQTRWLARPIRLGDVDGDGRLDIVGMLIHDETGALPADKAAVFWMNANGAPLDPGAWTTHVIKWSDGDSGAKWRGEKWDHVRFTDVDGDGDLDLMANCEEHYDEQHRTIIGVVWFERP